MCLPPSFSFPLRNQLDLFVCCLFLHLKNFEFILSDSYEKHRRSLLYVLQMHAPPPRVWACGVVQRNQHGLWGYGDPGSNPPRPLRKPVGRVLDLCAFPLPHRIDGDRGNCLIELTRKKDELEVENALALASYLIKGAASSLLTHKSSPVPIRIGFSSRITSRKPHRHLLIFICVSLYTYISTCR